MSWILTVLAVTIPVVWARTQLNAVYSVMEEHGMVKCGLPAMGIFLAAAFGSLILSAAANAFGWLAFHSLPRPRPLSRCVELALLALSTVPGLLVVGFEFLF